MQLNGRSSSHFTRIARIFAAECEVTHDFHIIGDLMSAVPDDYSGDPALKMPVLVDEDGTWFGSLGICRELARQSALDLDIVWLASTCQAEPAVEVDACHGRSRYLGSVGPQGR